MVKLKKVGKRSGTVACQGISTTSDRAGDVGSIWPTNTVCARQGGDDEDHCAARTPAHTVRRATSLLWGARRRLVIAGAIFSVLWSGGLIWFATPPSAENLAVASDAIVVLTGGSLRLQSGLQLLREGKGHKLFVSGVNQQVGLDELLRVSGNVANWASCCVALGHDADNTVGNARETAQWARRQGFRSLRLVTAWYHMPRSLLEFERAMPEIEIIAHPVFPEELKRDYWWLTSGTAALLVSEYVKFLGALLRPIFEPLQPVSAPEPAEVARGR